MATINDLTDQLLSNIFRNLDGLADFRKCRLVSRKWKRIVMDTSRDKFHVVYPLTDTTIHVAHTLKETLVSFDVYSFTGTNNNKVWRTSGIEPLMKTTEWLQFSGSEISTDKFRKIMGLANDSLKTLSLKSTNKNLMLPFLQWQKPLVTLSKISIRFYNFRQKQTCTFNTFTSTLEKWISLDCTVQLPVLESLNLYYDGTGGIWYYRNRLVKTEDLFRNYLAIAKLLLKYKQTLKEVQIKRVFTYGVMYFVPSHFQPKWTEMQSGLESLDELNLNRLKVSTCTTDLGCEEIELFGRPKNLKYIIFNNLICHQNSWVFLMSVLRGFNNENSRNLRSIKMNIKLWYSRDPTLAVNLGVLRECRSLKTLSLNLTSPRSLGGLFVKNLELLPTGISILRFASYGENHQSFFGVEILLSRQQIRWIVGNLRGLESFWMSLLLPDQTIENANNEQVEVAGEGNNEDDEDEDELEIEDGNGQPQVQQVVDERINRLVNINLDTFRDLLALPKLKDLRLNMMKARAFDAFRRRWEGQFVLDNGIGTTLDAIREYSDLLDAAGYTTSTSTSEDFGPNEIYGFVMLKSQRN